MSNAEHVRCPVISQGLVSLALIALLSPAAVADKPLPAGKFMHILGDNSVILPKCYPAWHEGERQGDKYDCEFVQLWLSKPGPGGAPATVPPPDVVKQTCDPKGKALADLSRMVDEALRGARAKYVETHYPTTARTTSKRWRDLQPLLASLKQACHEQKVEQAGQLLAKVYGLIAATRQCSLRLHGWEDTFVRDSPRSWKNKPQALGPCKCTRVSTFTLERFKALKGTPIDDWVYRSTTRCESKKAACKQSQKAKTLEASWWYGIDVALEDLGCETLRIGSAPHS